MLFGLNILDDKGIRKVWHRKPVILWKDVAYVETRPHSLYAGGYDTTIYSRDNKFSFGCYKGGTGGPNTGSGEIYGYYTILERIMQFCPLALSDHKTDFILKWGKELENYQSVFREYEQNCADTDTTIKLARLYILILNYSRAKKLLKGIIKSEPKNSRAMELLAIANSDRNISMFIKDTRTYNELIALCPDNAQFLSLAICSDPNPISQKKNISRLFEVSKKNFLVRFALIRNHLFRRDYREAKEHIRALKQEYAEDKKKESVNRILDYTTRYRTDIDFRNKINLKRDLSIVFWYIYLILVVLGIIFWVKYGDVLLGFYMFVGFGVISFIMLLLIRRIGLFY